MTQIETVQFSCPTCGKRLTARAEQGGRLYACPGCGSAVRVPSVAAVEPTPPVPSQPDPSEPDASQLSAFHRLPASVGELAIYLFIAWSIVGFLSLLAMFFGPVAAYVGLIMFLLASLVALHQAWQLLRAPQRVLSVTEVPLFWGTVRLIAWEPTEGVLILRNKAMTFKDDDLHDGKGGVRFIYPFLGEEVALRVPLETQSLHFADANVLTREYLSLSIRGTMKWRITDIEKFFLRVSREVRATGETQTAVPKHPPRGVPAVESRLVDAAIVWLRSIAEEQTRNVVSRVQSGLLIADKLMASVPEIRGNEGLTPAAEFGGATEGLASAIHDTVAERLKDYGISVAEVSLQEIRMPEEIVRGCIEAARTAYLPLMAQRQAAAKHADLKVEVDLLGKEAVGAREVLSHAPAYALRDFLTEFVSRNAAGAGQPRATIDLAQLAAIEANAPTRPALDAPPTDPS